MMRTDSAATAAAAEHRHLLADSVANFAARGTDLARVRRLRGTSAEYDRAVWKKGVRDVAGVETDFLNPYYYSRPATIYGGSSEIQRNILAKYVLKLPS